MTKTYTQGGVRDVPMPVDAKGHCVHCGRDNTGHEHEVCADDCPGYWEARGFPHPEA